MDDIAKVGDSIKITDVFEVMSIEEFEEKKRIAMVAQREMHNDSVLPPLPELSSIEASWCSDLQDEMTRTEQHAKQVITETTTAYETAGVDILEGYIDATLTSAETDMKSLAAQADGELQKLRDRHSGAKTNFAHFQFENDLKGNPKPQGNLITHSGFLFVALIVESVINMTLYAEASERGLLGGFFLALIVSIINVSNGILTGQFSLRWLHHKLLGKRAMGASFLVINILVTALINLMAGHFRTVLDEAAASGDIKNLLTVMVDAIDHMAANIVNVGSFNGWVLVAIGIIVVITTTIKQFYFEDPYPGFSGKHAAIGETWKTLRDELQDTEDRAVERARQSHAKLADIQQEGQKMLTKMGADLATIERYISMTDTHQRRLEDLASKVIESFRRHFRDALPSERKNEVSLDRIAPPKLKRYQDLAANLPSPDHLQQEREKFAALRKTSLTQAASTVEKLRNEAMKNLHNKYVPAESP